MLMVACIVAGAWLEGSCYNVVVLGGNLMHSWLHREPIAERLIVGGWCHRNCVCSAGSCGARRNRTRAQARLRWEGIRVLPIHRLWWRGPERDPLRKGATAGPRFKCLLVGRLHAIFKYASWAGTHL